MTAPTPATAPATATATAAATHPSQERAMQLDTIRDLLTAIDALPEPDRSGFRARVDDAITRPAVGTRAALGLIALDLAGAYREALRPEGVAERVIVLPDLAPADLRSAGTASAPVAASA